MGNFFGKCLNILRGPACEEFEVGFPLKYTSKKPPTNKEISFQLRQRFKDGHRTVDYVLAYEKTSPQHDEKRAFFEENLKREGLELEKEETQKVHFVKIHAPSEVLSRLSELLKMKLPLKHVAEQDQITEPEFKLSGSIRNFFTCKAAQLDPNVFPPPEHKLLYEYSRDKKDL